MPGAIDSSGDALPTVVAVAALLEEALSRVEHLKPLASIEPALVKADFGDIFPRLSQVFETIPRPGAENGSETPPDQNNIRQYAFVESAVRDLFSSTIAITSIDSAAFVRIWNLLDLVSILSDEEWCEPALLFWLVEELLDSQTISGCRKIFDFLESRRERITAKHFKGKQLVILRTCNELLRRLSRAEDTSFCGRVFIFMFQSFPLGDKSSVNLRGEFHVENETTFDQPLTDAAGSGEAMDVDTKANGKEAIDSKQPSKAVSFDGKKQNETERQLSTDELYPVFWQLQESFSQPKKLFENSHFSQFKSGLEATMSTFRTIQAEQGARPPKSKEDTNRVPKRKLEDGTQGDDSTNAFNPKYLTSRDLFELEISDLSFRRHILVQALIIMEFLLSLSSKAKEKLASVQPHNKAVTYMDQVLNEEDTKWAGEMKRSIAEYLKQGHEGPYFYRMVETVLSRDKNWVRWKIQNCPSIGKPPVSPDDYLDSKKAIQRMTANKRLRPTPMGSLPLDFLQDNSGQAAWERLKNPERFRIPDLATFKRKIADDDFEISMATDSKAKAAATERKAAHTWLALRIAARTNLSSFDLIDDPNNIDVVFETMPDPDAVGAEPDDVADAESMPIDKRPVVICGSSHVGKTNLIAHLRQRRPGVFKTVIRHTTRKPEDGEVNGRDFYFVAPGQFSVMLDGDQFLEFAKLDEAEYGTTRRSVDDVGEAGFVPVIEASREAAQQIRDMGYSCRFVLVKSPRTEILNQRMGAGEGSDDALRADLENSSRDDNNPGSNGGIDISIVNDELSRAVAALEKYIFDNPSTHPDSEVGKAASPRTDVSMT